MARSLTKREEAALKLDNISAFRGVQYNAEELPAPRNVRKLTDLVFLLFLVVGVGAVFGLLIFLSTQSNLLPYLNPADHCGDFCGVRNSQKNGISCSGKDLTNFPYLYNDICVPECPLGSKQIMNVCIGNSNDLDDLLDRLTNQIGLIIGTFAIGIIISGMFLIILRVYTKIFIYTMIILALLAYWALTILVWVISSSDTAAIAAAVVLTIVGLVMTFILFVLRKRINLLVRLLKESVRILFSMGHIFLLPLLTFLALAIATICYLTTLIMFLNSTSKSTDEDNGVINTSIISILISTFVYIWMLNFITACQAMVIAGAVAHKYFCSGQKSPIYESFYVLLRFHLGSPACGSFLVLFITILRVIIRSLLGRFRFICCCLGTLQRLVQYFTANGYIEVAIHGQGLFKSGKRAMNLIVANALSAFAINSISGFVFFMGKLLVVIITVGFGYLILDNSYNKTWSLVVTLLILALFTYIFIDAILKVVDVGLDTIFLCYCEDKFVNDGSASHPYCGSSNFQMYIKEAQQFQKEKKQQ